MHGLKITEKSHLKTRDLVGLVNCEPDFWRYTISDMNGESVTPRAGGDQLKNVSSQDISYSNPKSKTTIHIGPSET